MKLLILNGPNLNLIEHRNKNHYGQKNFSEILNDLKKNFPDIEFDYIQSNLEGELVNQIQTASSKYDGLIINPGGFAHTSVAIRDALELCNIPKIEVHLSNLAQREDFRQILLTAAKCNGYISGLKDLSYFLAVTAIKRIIDNK